MLGPQAPQIVRNLRSYARWAIRAKPGDHLVALSAASASLPVVGRHLELVSGFAALGVGGRHYLPGLVDGVRQTRSTPDRRELKRAQEALTPGILSDALDGIVAAELLGRPWPAHRERPPVLKALAQRRYVHRSSVRYGAHPGQLLDVWRGKNTPREPAPVLIFVPGGAWVFGRRELQGHALMAHLVRRGWVCLSVQYRASPRHRWPHQVIDVKTAIAWARANAHQFGGDREFIAIAGCSAGGHLATLAGLTAGDPQWQSDLAGNANTAVDAVVSLYGQYDWNDRSSDERERFMGFLETAVVRRVSGSPSRIIPCCVADRSRSTRRTPVSGCARQQRSADSGNRGAPVRRTDAIVVGVDSRICGASRSGPRFRLNRRRAHCISQRRHRSISSTDP